MRSSKRSVISKPHVVALALGVLGATGRSVDTEDVAIKAHELVPEFFSWRKYPNQIDLDLVRMSLRHAAEDAYGRLVDGSVKTGWSLTDDGATWYSQGHETLLRLLGTGKQPRSVSIRFENRKRIAERSRILLTDAWKGWNRQEPVSHRQAQEIFRIDQYTDIRHKELKIRQQTNLLREDSLLGQFVLEMAKLARVNKDGKAE